MTRLPRHAYARPMYWCWYCPDCNVGDMSHLTELEAELAAEEHNHEQHGGKA